MIPTPAGLPSPVEAALEDASAELRRLYGDRFVRAVLFGSYARGEARPHDGTEPSDVDVLVVLRRPFQPYEEAVRLGSLAMDLTVRHGVAVTFLPITEERAGDPLLPLMVNVNREGVEL